MFCFCPLRFFKTLSMCLLLLCFYVKGPVNYPWIHIHLTDQFSQIHEGWERRTYFLKHKWLKRGSPCAPNAMFYYVPCAPKTMFFYVPCAPRAMFYYSPCAPSGQFYYTVDAQNPHSVFVCWSSVCCIANSNHR